MKKNRERSKIVTIISWVLVFMWMVIIFNFSSQKANESKGVSTYVTEKVYIVVEKISPKKNLITFNDMEHYIRKMAHFSIYMILGFLILNALDNKDIKFVLIICILYAISDEFHQSFVPGRGPQLKDVFIDTAGSICGIISYSILNNIKMKICKI